MSRNGGDGAPPMPGASSEAELAQAFQALARGEQQASAMEANLAKLESKLDALLAQFEASAGPSLESSSEAGQDEKKASDKDRTEVKELVGGEKAATSKQT